MPANTHTPAGCLAVANLPVSAKVMPHHQCLLLSTSDNAPFPSNLLFESFHLGKQPRCIVDGTPTILQDTSLQTTSHPSSQMAVIDVRAGERAVAKPQACPLRAHGRGGSPRK